MKQLTFLLFLHTTIGAITINMDFDYSMGYVIYSQLGLDFKDERIDLPYQRFRFDLGVKKKNFEVKTRIQSTGILGSTSPFTLNDYHWTKDAPFSLIKTNSEPFIEHIYIKVSSPLFLPCELTFGRQEVELDDGFVLSDNTFGLNSIKLLVNYPSGFRNTVFYIRPFTASTGKKFDIYALHIFTVFRLHDLCFSYITERDETGISYKESINSVRDFYTISLKRNMRRYFYYLIGGLQTGKVWLRDPKKEIEIGGYGFKAELGMRTEKSFVGETTFRLHFAYGSHNDATTIDIDESYRPTFSKRFNGLFRQGYGEFYSGSLYDAIFYPDKYTGMTNAGFKFDISPLKNLKCDISFFTFFAIDEKNEAKRLGSEFNLGAYYNFMKEINLKSIFAIFLPDKESFGKENVTSLMFKFEINGRI